MTDIKFLTTSKLENGLEAVRQSPRDAGRLVMIVRRPAQGQREVLQQGELDLAEGLVGDGWKLRGSPLNPDGSADLEAQLTLMNARAIQLLAQAQERWPLAGDQLFVDLDLSVENLPPGSRLAIGPAVIEVTARPHTGCNLFQERFGRDAVLFVNSKAGKELRLRGLNARVVQPGVIHTGDTVQKCPTQASKA